MSYRAYLADGLSIGNGASGVAGAMVLLAWDDPRALWVACLCVFIGWGFDSVDGLAARGLKRSPAEGIVLDSLCDTSSFGVLPAILLAAYGLGGHGVPAGVGIGGGIIYFGCVIARLRRYTVNALDHTATQRTSFQGLPSPVAAMAIAASTMTAASGPPALAWLPIAFAAVSAPLMLSRVPYQETPRVAAWTVRAIWPLPVLAVIAWLAGSVPVALTVLFAGYVASGVSTK